MKCVQPRQIYLVLLWNKWEMRKGDLGYVLLRCTDNSKVSSRFQKFICLETITILKKDFCKIGKNTYESS